MCLSGQVAYTDGSKDSFEISVDEDGNIETNGTAHAFADIKSTIQGLFTAMGGTLTTSPATSGKTVKDKTTRIMLRSTISTGDAECYAEYTVKSGTVTNNGLLDDGIDAYDQAVDNFVTTMQNAINALLNVTVTIT